MKMSAHAGRSREALVAQVPQTRSLSALRNAARSCEACPLYQNATQTVFGEGPRHAAVVLIGEQPGDEEDRKGKPFVGPAGRLLDRALTEAGVDRSQCYVTNVVKHFKWEPRGKRRLHQKPNSSEIAACRPWWKAELALIKPRILVCLGSTAARAVFGREVKVMRERGKVVATPWAERTLITIHPSALLRVPDAEAREQGFALFVRELTAVSRWLDAPLKRAPQESLQSTR
jgi:uracil-DNA glycosylase family protein